MASRPPKAHPNKRAARARVRSAPKGNPKRRRSPPPPPPPQFTPLNIAYDWLRTLIRDLPDFKWPLPMRAGPDLCNRSLKCDYHKDHDYETIHCQSLKFLVEKLIRAEHRRVATAPIADRVVIGTEHALGPRPAINFILGGPDDSQYQFKKQRREMLQAASVRAKGTPLAPERTSQQFSRLTTLYPFPLLTLPRSLPLITMHLYLPCVLTVLMCTGSSSIQVVQLIYYISQPLSR